MRRSVVYGLTTVLMAIAAAGFAESAVVYEQCAQTAYPKEVGQCLAGVWMFGLLALLLAAGALYRCVVLVRRVRAARAQLEAVCT